MSAIADLKEVVKDYEAGSVKVRALGGVNLAVNAGEFTSIAGPSGSGKTTLLNLVGCLDVPTEGKIFLDGEDTGDRTKRELAEIRRHKIGFIFQTFNLVPVLTAFENVELSLSLLSEVKAPERTERVERILGMVGLKDMMRRRPVELSGGQQQRVAIARALVKKPKLVLADEPTANLDSKTGENVLELMLKINREEKATFIFSTHDRMVMDYARRLLVIKDGLIVEDERRGGGQGESDATPQA